MRLTAQQKKNLYYLVPLIVLLIGTFLFYLLAIRVRPNDKILTNSEGVALFANENPTFEVQFGDKENPDGQWIRFEAKTSNDNPFSSEEKKNIFTKIANIFTPKKKSGIEMSLRGVDFSETEKDGNAQYDEEVKKVADILGTEEIKTSTVLTEMGREIGENEGDQNISKQTVVNQGVADGVDLEYQVLKGLGLKEEIVVNDLEAYRKSCDEGCKLPLNEFVFDIKMDSDVRLKKGWYTVEGKSVETYYFVNDKGKYLAHFLPNYAIDYSGNKTYKVDLVVTPGTDGNYEAKVTVDSDWLLDPNRTYPIRIDPSIVHDDSTDFSTGIPYGTKYFSGIGLKIADFSLVGSWNMNEAANGTCSGGGDICDQSGNNYNATITGTATPVSAYEMLGRDFDGVTGTYASLGDQAAFEVQSFTIEAYAKKEGTCGPYNYCTIMSKGGSGSKGFGFAIYGGKLHLRINDLGTGSTQFLTGTTTLSDNVWYYVAVSVDGVTKTINLYLNGNLEATGRYTDTISYGTENVKFGNSNSGNDLSMNGVIDSVRFWNVAKDANYIKNSYLKYGNSVLGTYSSSSLNLSTSVSGMTMSWLGSGVNTGNGETPYSTTGMVAQWNFNETSGTTAVSGGTCGTSCNGTLTNMTTTGQDAAAMTGWTANNRRWGTGAVMFDGSNDYVTVSSQASLNITGTITIESWIKPLRSGAADSSEAFVWKGNVSSATDQSYGLIWTSTNNVAFRVASATTPYNSISKALTLGDWYHVVGVYDGTYMYIYINGVLSNSNNIGSISIKQTTQPLMLGTSYIAAPYEYFNGVIDSTRIYSRALSANEILSNYQAGNIEFQYRTSTDNSTWSNWTSYNDGALMFDGNDDYVNVGDIAAVDALTSFSTCAWVNNDTLTTDSMIWSKVDNTNWSGIMFVKDIVGQVSGRTNMYKIWVGQNNAAAFIEGATNSATTGAWQQVCATFTANSTTGLRLYVNGVEDANSPVSTVGITGLDAGTNLLTIGKYNNGTSYVDGSIDNVQIYNRVLAGSEITSNYNVSDFETPYSSTGLLAHWKFNELSGTTAVSGGTCGVACNGTLTNFSSTTGRDSSTTSGWTAKTKLGSDYPEYSFDNPYLYKTDDTGLVGYWPMEEANGSGAYIKDVSTPFAVGGTVTYADGYTIHTFKANDTFTVNGSGSVQALIVGGGGSGGYGHGGGGGGGSVLYSSSVTVTSGTGYTITVGAGGVGHTSNADNHPGGSSSAFGVTATGGGAGANEAENDTSGRNGVGGAGANSGGGSYTPRAAGVATAPTATGWTIYGGNSGGAGAPGTTTAYGCGGGGGAGSPALNVPSVSAPGGSGGSGIANAIMGINYYWGGGGGGSAYGSSSYSAGSGGLGGGGGAGGDGGSVGGSGGGSALNSGGNGPTGSDLTGGAGGANTGGGGGGGSNENGNGGTGGSGIVIVRYPSSYTATTTDTIGDAIPTGTTYVGGKYGGARSFNAPTDMMAINPISLSGIDYTIETWFQYPLASATDWNTLARGNADHQVIVQRSTMLLGMYDNSGGTGFNSSGFVMSTLNNGWHHMAAVGTGTVTNFYIDGRMVGSSAKKSSSTIAYIGNYQGGAQQFGTIDEVRIFNLALSASTISSDYIKGITNKSSVISQAGSSLKIEGMGSNKLTSGPYVTDPNTIGLWHMDERGGTGAYLKDSASGVSSPFASGGTISYSGGYTIHTFTSSGTFVANGSGNVEVLVVAGGGGGGSGAGGGGGAGGVIQNSSFAISTGSISVTVGGGGAGGGGDSRGGNGGNSVFSTLTAIGGGGGAGGAQTSTSGGSGGGGSYAYGASAGTAGQGNSGAGGNGSNAGGGGGGAGGAGGSTTGGIGITSSISGSSLGYAGGGGGGVWAGSGPASYGGGAGGIGSINQDPSSGIANTGGGGGGGRAGVAGPGGNGGSGIVIVRYLSSLNGVSGGNHGTPTGTTYTNSGKIGGSRTLSGSTSYINAGNGSGLNLTSAYTLEAWINLSSNCGGGSGSLIISKANYGSVTGGYDWGCITESGYTNRMYIINQNTAGQDIYRSTVSMAANQWHYVAVTFASSQPKFYVDGIAVTGAFDSGSSMRDAGINTNNVFIGNHNIAQTLGLLGTVDEVRISNIARTANEIAESYKLGKDSYINQTLNTINLSTKNTMAINIASDRPGTYLSAILGESAYSNYQPDSSTLGLWHLDEISGSGAYTKDASSYGNNGTPTGTTYTSNGKLGGARTFSGSDYITGDALPEVGSLFASAGNPWSTQCWFKHGTSVPANHAILGLSGGTGTSATYVIYVDTSGNLVGVIRGTPTTIVSGINDNNWHNVAITWDGTTVKAYLDGVYVKSLSVGTVAVQAYNFNIGGTANGASSLYVGDIDEVAVSTRTRTPDEIRQAYEVGLRTHNITVTFGAGLASGNLITGSSDYSFSIDATKYGLPSLGSDLYAGDKVIVKENYDGTEYIAQGTVTSVNLSTGATVVSSWDSGSTFPSGGYTVNADVFKWQKEYIPVKNRTISTQVDVTNLLTFRLNDGNEGRNIWIDDLRSSTGYLKNSSSEAITFVSNAQYAQYKAIFTSWDSNVTPYISQVQVDYTASGPTIDQLMRHGMWFDSSGAKQSFWWVGTH